MAIKERTINKLNDNTINHSLHRCSGGEGMEERGMKVLELFAGDRSFGKVAEYYGMEVFSIDWQNFPGIHLSKDIGQLTFEDVPFIPDIVWASPDCTTYTIAAISHHRNGTCAKSEYAKKCDEVNQHFIGLIKLWITYNPNLVFFIENPRGMLRKMPFMQEFTRHTVWYCQYGDDRAKPTDIWTNSKKWIPRRECHNGNPNYHHQSAPRGSKTGTQGRNGSFERSKIPGQLMEDIVVSTLSKKLKKVINTPFLTRKKKPHKYDRKAIGQLL